LVPLFPFVSVGRPLDNSSGAFFAQSADIFPSDEVHPDFSPLFLSERSASFGLETWRPVLSVFKVALRFGWQCKGHLFFLSPPFVFYICFFQTWDRPALSLKLCNRIWLASRDSVTLDCSSLHPSLRSFESGTFFLRFLSALRVDHIITCSFTPPGSLS